MKKIEEDNTLVFIVDLRANKNQIKEVVKALYNIEAAKVNTLVRYSPFHFAVDSNYCYDLRFGTRESMRLVLSSLGFSDPSHPLLSNCLSISVF